MSTTTDHPLTQHIVAIRQFLQTKLDAEAKQLRKDCWVLTCTHGFPHGYAYLRIGAESSAMALIHADSPLANAALMCADWSHHTAAQRDLEPHEARYDYAVRLLTEMLLETIDLDRAYNHLSHLWEQHQEARSAMLSPIEQTRTDAKARTRYLSSEMAAIIRANPGTESNYQ